MEVAWLMTVASGCGPKEARVDHDGGPSRRDVRSRMARRPAGSSKCSMMAPSPGLGVEARRCSRLEARRGSV